MEYFRGESRYLQCFEDYFLSHGKTNVEFGFPGNCAIGGKSLQFSGEIYHLDGYFCLFLTKIANNV